MANECIFAEKAVGAGRGILNMSHICAAESGVLPQTSVWTPEGAADAQCGNIESRESSSLREAFESVSIPTSNSRTVGPPEPVTLSTTEHFPENQIVVSSDEDKFEMTETVRSMLEHIGNVLENPVGEPNFGSSDRERFHSNDDSHIEKVPSESGAKFAVDGRSSVSIDKESAKNYLHKTGRDVQPKKAMFHTIFESVSKPTNELKYLDNQDHSAKSADRSFPSYQQYDNEKTGACSKNRLSRGECNIFNSNRQTSQRSTISPARSNHPPSPTGRGAGLLVSKPPDKKPGGIGRGSLLKLITK